MFGAVRAFEMKLILYVILLHKDGSVSFCAVEIIYSLAENFKIRSNDFRSYATNIHNSENPFSVEVSDVTEQLQLELTELQYDWILLGSSNQEALITFYASSPVSRSSDLCKLA
jgi:hypothetical protein